MKSLSKPLERAQPSWHLDFGLLQSLNVIEWISGFVVLFFFFFGHAMQHMACQPGTEPLPHAVEARTLNHWTAKGSSHFCCFQWTLFVVICYGSLRKLHTGSERVNVWSDVGWGTIEWPRKVHWEGAMWERPSRGKWTWIPEETVKVPRMVGVCLVSWGRARRPVWQEERLWGEN